MKKLFIFFILTISAFAQKEYMQWVVSDSMLYDFNDPNQVKLLRKHYFLGNITDYFETKINDKWFLDYEPYSLYAGFICDKKGQLLIYSDGRRVFNKYNIQVDSNRMGFVHELKYEDYFAVKGFTFNASNFTMIVKKPGCNDSYLLFYTGNNRLTFLERQTQTLVPASLYYYEFQITDEGYYKRLTETKLLKDSIFEGFNITKSKNNIDLWVVCMDSKSRILSYKIDDSGLKEIPTVSQIDVSLINYKDYYRFSNTKDQVGTYNSFKFLFGNSSNYLFLTPIKGEFKYLFDFNNKTGEAKFNKLFGSIRSKDYKNPYINFFFDSNIESNYISIGNYDEIWYSKQTFESDSRAIDTLAKHAFFAFTPGVDTTSRRTIDFNIDEIYYNALAPYNQMIVHFGDHAKNFKSKHVIWSIYNLDKPFEETNYKTVKEFTTVYKYDQLLVSDIVLNPPILPGGYLGPEIYKEKCESDSIELVIQYELDESDSIYEWEGPHLFKSKERNPKLYNLSKKNEGWYNLKVKDKRINCFREFQIFLTIHDNPKDKIEIYHDKPLSLCEGDSLILAIDTNFNFAKGKWTTGENSRNIKIKSTGTYGVILTNERGCEKTQFVTITPAVRPLPVIVKLDEFVCAKDPVRLTVDNPYSHYLWNTGDTTRTITANRDGLFKVKVWNDSSMCEGFADIYVRYETKPKPQFISNTPRICNGDSIFVSIDPKNINFYTYQWEDGNREPERWLSKQGDYKLVLIDNRTQCRDSNVFKLIVEDAPKVEITKSKALCNAESVILSTNYEGSNTTYLWNNGATSASITTNQAGVYSCIVTLNGKCSGFGVFTLNYETISTPAILGDTLLCKGKTITLSLQGSYNSQTWSTGETTPQISLDKAGLYSVIVSNGSCTASSNVEVKDFINNNLIADIDFGDIELNGTYQKEVASNVKSARFKDGTNFTLEIIGNKLILKAKPSTKGIQSDSLYVVYTTICNDSNSIQVKANVIESSPPITKIHLSIDDVKIVVGDTNNYLPIRIKVLDNPQNKERIIVRGKIATKNLILKPLREVYNRQNDSTYIEFSATYTTSSTNDILLNIKGIGLLVEVTKANYNFSIVEVDKNTELTTKDGTVEVSGICAPSLRLVTIFEPPKLTINPNPADNDVAISLESKLEGTHLLEVINSTGEIVFTKEYLPQSDKEVIYLSKVQISNGIYFVRFTPPYNLGSLQEKLIVR